MDEYQIANIIIAGIALVISAIGLVVAFLAKNISKKSTDLTKNALELQKKNFEIEMKKIIKDYNVGLEDEIERCIGDIKNVILDSYRVSNGDKSDIESIKKSFNNIQEGFIRLKMLGKYDKNSFLINFSNLEDDGTLPCDKLFAKSISAILSDYIGDCASKRISPETAVIFKKTIEDFYFLIYKYFVFFEKTNTDDENNFYNEVKNINEEYKDSRGSKWKKIIYPLLLV